LSSETKARLYAGCIMVARGDGNVMLVTDFIYRNIKVPAGYVTNGANIPRIFWSVIPPFSPQLLPAVIVHDYLCDKEAYALADKAFEQMLRELEVSVWKRVVMVCAVKWYHRIRYGVKQKC